MTRLSTGYTFLNIQEQSKYIRKNIENINCFSDEGSGWDKSNITFNKNILKLNFREKFTFRRGRVNCSLNDDGIWRWFGVQFSVNQN